MNPQPKQNPGGCPSGWRDSEKPGGAPTNTCYPGVTAKAAYPLTTGSCAAGYIKSGIKWCIQGEQKFVQATAGSVRKANPLDRCPVGYFTYSGDGNMCTSNAASPPTVRLKGEGACNAGELEDWGVWCVSNYEGLTRKDAAKGYPDHNAIYQTSYKLTGKQQASRMADLPEGKEYTPAYFLIFGRVDRDGNPIPGGSGAAAVAADSTARPAAAADAAVKQCVPAPKPKKKGLGGALGGLAKDVAADLGVSTSDGC